MRIKNENNILRKELRVLNSTLTEMIDLIKDLSKTTSLISFFRLKEKAIEGGVEPWPSVVDKRQGIVE